MSVSGSLCQVIRVNKSASRFMENRCKTKGGQNSPRSKKYTRFEKWIFQGVRVLPEGSFTVGECLSGEEMPRSPGGTFRLFTFPSQLPSPARRYYTSPGNWSFRTTVPAGSGSQKKPARLAATLNAACRPESRSSGASPASPD